MPNDLAETFEGLDADPETRKLVAASVAVELVQRLINAGCGDIHFYTLNRAELTLAICRRLGLKPTETGAAA